MTDAQRRLIDTIKSHGDFAEYWPVINDWVKDKGPAQSLAFRNGERTVAACIRKGYITLDYDGLLHLTARAR